MPWKPLLASVLVTVFGSTAVSGAERVAVAVRAGTTGLGLEAAASLGDKVGVRAGGYTFSYSRTEERSDLTYDAELKLRSLAGFIDVHPTGGAFRFSGGLVYNKNRVEAIAVPTGGTFNINGVAYPAALVGTLTGVGRIGNREWAPYLGLGFGSARGSGRAFFAFDLGVVFQGRPTVDLSATGLAAANAQFQANLQAEEDDVNADLDDTLYKYYPVVSIGLGFRF